MNESSRPDSLPPGITSTSIASPSRIQEAALHIGSADQAPQRYSHLANNTNQYAGATFLDYSKAFDLVWTEGLLLKLRKLQLHGNIYNFIISFLQHRTIQINIKGALSNTHHTNDGLSQASVISPLFFIIYINDIPIFLHRNSITSIFADDCAIWQSSTNRPYQGSYKNHSTKKSSGPTNGDCKNTDKTINLILAKVRSTRTDNAQRRPTSRQ